MALKNDECGQKAISVFSARATGGAFHTIWNFLQRKIYLYKYVYNFNYGLNKNSVVSNQMKYSMRCCSKVDRVA